MGPFSGDLQGSGATRVKDLDSVELGLLGNTVDDGANGASNVSSMAVAVAVGGVDGIEEPSGTAFELLPKFIRCAAGHRRETQILTEWPTKMPVSMT